MNTITKMWTLGACLSIATIAGTAQADDLLIIDLTVENQITISATDGLSAATVSGSNFTGVYMNNFYGAAGGSLAAGLVGGDIAPASSSSDGTPALFRGGFGTDTGLNLWSFATDATFSFTAGQEAFTGSATWSLSAAEYADMVNGNTSGDLYFPADTSDDITAATLIGTYQVIPAPGAMSLIGLGLGMGAMRRRR